MLKENVEMLKENEAFLKTRLDVVKKEKGTIESC